MLLQCSYPVHVFVSVLIWSIIKLGFFWEHCIVSRVVWPKRTGFLSSGPTAESGDESSDEKQKENTENDNEENSEEKDEEDKTEGDENGRWSLCQSLYRHNRQDWEQSGRGSLCQSLFHNNRQG